MRRLEMLFTGILALCAVVVTIVVVRREFMPPPDPNAPRPPTAVANWSEYAIGNKRIGSQTALVTLVEFSDFQCPACRQLSRVLEKLRAKHGDQLAIVYRHFPIESIHPLARPAALAAECAATQGRFAAYHDYLFANQDSLPRMSWSVVAAKVGVSDTTAFARCLTDPHTLATLSIDSLAGVNFGVTGTPQVTVNKWRMSVGAPTEEALEQIISDELKRASHK